jgi:hypothetical protein
MPHVGRSYKLSFFHVHRPSRGRGRQKDVSLPAEERRDLKKLTHMPGCRRLIGQMNIRRHGQTRRASHTVQDGEALVHTRASIGMATRAIGFVERRLEDHLDRQAGSERGKMVRDEEAQILSLNDARTGNDEQWLAWTTAIRADDGGKTGIHAYRS